MHNSTRPRAPANTARRIVQASEPEPPDKDKLNAWAEAIIRSGIGGAVPLPFMTKTPTPTGYQGGKNDYSKCCSPRAVRGVIANGFKAKDPDTGVLARYQTGGLAIRPADGVIIIDIDCYDGKRGAKTLAGLEARWGKLPPMYYLTSRGRSNPSRKLIFRATAGVRYGNPGGDIEIIQPHHRYAVAPPSVHAEGRPEVLYGPDREELSADEFPALADLAALPQKWDKGLQGLDRQEANGKLSMPAMEWLEEHGQYEPCAQTDRTMKLWIDRLESGEPWEKDGSEFSLYRTGRAAAWAIVSDCADGHEGAWSALKLIRDAYFEAGKVGGKTEARLTYDWRRCVADAIVDKASDDERPDDWCGDKAGKAVLGTVFDRTELKNIPKAEPLIDDWVDLRTTVMLVGATGTDKTFTLIGWACSIATGTAWLGNEVHGQFPVILVIGEGAGGLDDRISAWEKENKKKIGAGMLTVYRLPPTIMDPEFWEELRNDAAGRGARFIGLDTFSSLAPGADETKDAAWTVRQMEETSVDIDGTVVMVAHSGWSDKLRVRGGSQFEFNPDSVVIASKTDEENEDAPVRLWLKKEKDGPQGRKIWVRRRAEGESCVLEQVPEPAGGMGGGVRLSADDMKTAIGEWIQDHGPDTQAEIVDMVHAENDGTGKNKWKAAFRGMRDDGDLEEIDLVQTVTRGASTYEKRVSGWDLRPGWPKIIAQRARTAGRPGLLSGRNDA